MEKVKITYGSDTVMMEWDGSQASAPILLDGESTPYQTADARHRTDLAVALMCRYAWPESDWPHVPSTGSVAVNWDDGSEAWDEIAYETVAEAARENPESPDDY